jgi:hypothetical protein
VISIVLDDTSPAQCGNFVDRMGLIIIFSSDRSCSVGNGVRSAETGRAKANVAWAMSVAYRDRTDLRAAGAPAPHLPEPQSPPHV